MTKKILLIIGILIVVGLVWWGLGSNSDLSESSEQSAGLEDVVQNTSTETSMVSDLPDMLTGEDVPYYGELSETVGYLATPTQLDPANPEPKPALILIHEWWGLTDDVRQMADNFAKQGYVALAVDMYSGQSTDDPAVARELSSSVRDSVDPAFANLQAAIDYLSTRDDVDVSKLASVGWCFGGQWAYQMALNDLDIEASVMYYGQFNPDDDFSMMRADILGHFGAEDAVIEIDNVKEFQANLATTKGSHSVFIYPNVGHGFANYRGGDNLAYDEEAAEIAWERTMSFLSQRLGN